MPAPNTISIEKLSRLVGTPNAPVILDVRNVEDFGTDPRLVPASQRQSYTNVQDWCSAYAGKTVAVVCHHGAKLSHGSAAWFRQAGADAVSVEDGFEGWKAASVPLVHSARD